jgi:hypothetical protein
LHTRPSMGIVTSASVMVLCASTETKSAYSKIGLDVTSQAWWYTPIIPATQKVEVGVSHLEASSRS